MVEPLSEDTKEALKAQGNIDEAAVEAIRVAEEAATRKAAEENKLSEITLEKPEVKPEESDLNKIVNKTLEGAGYTEEMVSERLIKDGGLSDEFLAELKGKVDPDFIDAHAGRIRAEIELAKVKESGRIEEIEKANKVTSDMNQHIYNAVGGEDKFNILKKTLKDKLSPDDLAAFNVKLSSGNKTLVNEAMKDIVKKYNDIRGMGGTLMEGDAGVAPAAQEHLTKEEYRIMMRTDKYKTDPIFARKIDADRLKTRENDSKRYGHGHYFGYHVSKGKYAL